MTTASAGYSRGIAEASTVYKLVIEPTHLKNMQPSNWIISRKDRGKKPNNIFETTTLVY